MRPWLQRLFWPSRGRELLRAPLFRPVYAVTGRYPYRIGDLLSSVWNFLDGPAGPLLMLSDGLSVGLRHRIHYL
jgi:hypothetical protein